MSNLLVQNIKHTNNTTSMAIDSSGQVTIRGEGSATTTNLQQGLCKVWVNFVGTGTVSISNSLNVASLTDNDTGDYSISFTNNMANTNWSSQVDTNSEALGNHTVQRATNNSGRTKTTSQVQLSGKSYRHSVNDRNIPLDVGELMNTLNGDLA